MKTLIVFFNLKAGISAEEYEAWAKSTDLPTVKGLKSVEDFQLYRSDSVFGSDAQPPYQYFEMIHIADMEKFGEEVGDDTMQKVAGEFQSFADQPMFILTDSVA